MNVRYLEPISGGLEKDLYRKVKQI
jgi:hypothetical protein